MKTDGTYQGIRARFIRWTAVLAISICVLGTGLFYLTLSRVISDVGSDFAEQYTLREKGRILTPLEREAALCEALTKNPILTDWVRDENNPVLKAAALRELESFRKEFSNKSCFFAIRNSGNFYFRDESKGTNGDRPAYILSPQSTKDSWFYSTLQKKERLHVNLNQIVAPGKTMVWISTVMHIGNDPVAVVGSGLGLNTLIDRLVNSHSKSATPILVDSTGTILAHSNTNLIDHDTLAKKAGDRSTIFRLMPNERDREDLRKAFLSLKAAPDSVAALSFVIEGKRRQLSVAYVPQIDWYLVSLIDLSMAGQMARFAPLALLVLLALGVLLAAITLLIDHTVLKPLNGLTARARSIAAGNFSVRAKALPKDEFGDFIQAFNSMLDAIESNARALKLKNDELEYRLQQRTKELETAVKERQKAEEAAQEAGQARNKLLANMSHDIPTPMNAILGFSEILENQIQDPRHQQYIRAIHSSAKSLLAMINDGLDLSKVEAGKLHLEYSTINPGGVLKELERIFARKIQEKGLTYLTEIDKVFPKSVILDETRLRQILLNLVGNAIKFTEHGFVRVVARTVPQSPGIRRTLVFEVHDSGVGIPRDRLDTIFKGFDQKTGQSQAKQGGAGFGLTISKHLAQLMGGTITVESEPGKGSNFSVTLRDVEETTTPETSDQKSPDNHATIVFEPASILVAEDVSLNRELIKGYLEGSHLEILEALDGHEAVALARDKQPALILMDIMMPGMNGAEASRILKNDPKTRSIPIVAVTASAMKSEEAQITAICEGFLSKPISRAELMKVLARFLKHSKKGSSQPDKSGQEESLFELNPNDFHDTEGLKRRLETELAPLWKEAQRTVIINQVLEFAEKTIAVASMHKASRLAAWGDKLRNEAMHFDMQSMEHTLAQFPKFFFRSGQRQSSDTGHTP
jgi:signal transduction histidine kinase/DNA-binding response OmpR family regulator